MKKRWLVERGGVWYYVRRVPKEFAELDPRPFIRQSTKVLVNDDVNGTRAARLAADKINRETEEYWRGLLDGRAEEARKRYDDARQRARAFGFDYSPASDLANRSTEEILRRVEALVAGKHVDSEKVVAAVLGGEKPIDVMLSEMFETYKALVRTNLLTMSKNQVRKWENGKKRAVQDLIAVVGDKKISDLNRDDGLAYRNHWQDKVVAKGLTPGTANKQFGHINSILKEIDVAHQTSIALSFSGIRLDKGKDRRRPAFTPVWVQTKILATGALDDLDEECRHVIYVMTETGLRPSEIVNLTENTISLGADIPYVSVKPEGRKLKTEESSERDVPLVGVALQVMKTRPGGFPHYRDKSDSLSANVNKFLLNHGLRPTKKHVLYSLRHTFKDRLTDVGTPSDLIDMLMGHTIDKPKYGNGPSLVVKHRYLKKICFRPPSRL